MEVFRRQCGARMHWGKAGWPAHAACFDGAAEYPDTWCDFGCAVQVSASSPAAWPLLPSSPARPVQA